MTVYHPTLKNRFKSFPPENQILMVCNELNRAKNNLNNESEYKQSLLRAVELLQFTLASDVWNNKRKELARAKECIARGILHTFSRRSLEILISTMIQLHPKSFQMIRKKR